MTGGRHPGDELFDDVGAADLIETVVVAQLLGDGQMIDLLVGLVELEHRREHGAVFTQVEVLRAELLIHQQRVQMLLVEQDRAKHRLLGHEVMRDRLGGRGAHRWTMKDRPRPDGSLPYMPHSPNE